MIRPALLCRPLCFALVVALLPASLVVAALPSWLAPITQTASPFIGVTHYQITQSVNNPWPAVLPRELSIHIVEIDPSAPGVSFFGTPGNGAVAEEYTRRTTSSFVNNYDLAVAINGDFYTTNTGANASVSGLGMSNGVVVSPGVSGRPSFIVRQNETVVVNTNGTIPIGSYNAVSGNQLLVRNSVNVTPGGSYTTTLNPHTAIGVNARNGHIFFMTVDGRQTNFSEGMRTDEMAAMLIDFGVTDAINLDGGGSTTMVFADGANGNARTVNSPADGSSSTSPGGERSVANHFGIFATPNPGYVPLPKPPRPQAATPDPLLASLTILDGFNGGEGRFTSHPYTGSGSTNGINPASNAVYSTAEAQAGVGSQKITLVRDSSSTARVRHLSGGGVPSNNRVSISGQSRAMGPNGYVGFFLKTTDANLQVGIGIDDGASAGSTGLEVSNSINVIADGQWHLYEWNLDDPGQWANFSGGNGTIDGPNAYIDSIFIYAGAGTANQTLTMFLDTVAYNPFGSLAELVPLDPADFNGDGRVDGADLAAWRNNFGKTAGADADSDGDVDGADFLQWQRRLGTGVAASVAAAQVPEPAAVVVALLAAVSLVAARSSGRRSRRQPLPTPPATR